MDIGWLAFAAILARNVSQYKTKKGLKINRRLYKDSKKLLKAIKASYGDVIPKDYWEYYYLHRFFVYIKSGKANSIEEAVDLYDRETKDYIESLI